MRVAVAGLWHLGSITAACCASCGHDVVAYDSDPDVIRKLLNNELPVEEPGLAQLVESGNRSGNLRFVSDPQALAKTELLWVTYDTPVDEEDRADLEYVFTQLQTVLPVLSSGSLVLISSQLPIGSTAKLERDYPRLRFAYSPENLRLGKAIEVFTDPDRVVIGVRDAASKELLRSLFEPITQSLEWMSVESAEMTKHALNAFLATSVTFINELATLCEVTGADAVEVERGLKTDVRIGPKAYLHPGAAFAGGTLARDLSFLIAAGERYSVPTKLFSGVIASNSVHKLWAQRRLSEKLGDLHSKVVSVLGLTYKPGTNTLRRSGSIEVCRWLKAEGACIQAFDPAIQKLPDDLEAVIDLKSSISDALSKSEAVLVATAWPEFKKIDITLLTQAMQRPLVLDPTRHLESSVQSDKRIEYIAIGACQ